MVIPSRPTDVTPAWLSSVLNIDVRDVAVAPIGTGQTGATYRVSATYATGQPGPPGTFAIKLPAQDETVRERVTIGYRSEHAFYTGVADRVQIPTRSASTAKSPTKAPISSCCSPTWRQPNRATR